MNYLTDLKRHLLRRHNSTKTWQCNHCYKMFKTQYEMLRHTKRTHPDENNEILLKNYKEAL